MGRIIPIVLAGTTLISTAGLVLMLLYGVSMGVTPVPCEAAAMAATETKEEMGPPLYHEIKDFTMNFVAGDGRTRYMQISFEVLTRDQTELESLQQYEPAIRNDFLFALSGKNAEDLLTREGKDAFRAEAMQIVQGTIEKRVGKQTIEDVFVTKLVLQ